MLSDFGLKKMAAATYLQVNVDSLSGLKSRSVHNYRVISVSAIKFRVMLTRERIRIFHLQTGFLNTLLSIRSHYIIYLYRNQRRHLNL